MSVPEGDDLGRLLAEGLRRDVDGPVDEQRLVAGARIGAARIHRRRRTMTAVAAAVLVVPAGLFGVRLVLDSGSGSMAAGSAAGAPIVAGSGDAAASSGSLAERGATKAMDAAGSGSGPAARSSLEALAAASAASGGGAGGTVGPEPQSAPALPAPTASPRPPAAPSVGPATPSSTVPATRVAVPSAALLTAADLAAVTGGSLTVVADSDNTAASAPVESAEVCGRALGSLPAEAGGRAVTYDRAPGTPSAWTAVTSVRVFAGTGPATYLGVLGGQTCLVRVSVSGADAALAGHGPGDAAGRTHWYAVARRGRAITEVRLTAPKGAAVTQTSLTRLLAVAVGRLTVSGLP